jgi:hypothetical protein
MIIELGLHTGAMRAYRHILVHGWETIVERFLYCRCVEQLFRI